MAQPTAADRAPSAAPAHDRYAAMVERCLAKLEQVADIGMEMAEELPRKVAGLRPYGAEKYEAEIAAMIARAYKDVGTTVQQSVAIQLKTINDLRRPRPKSRAEPKAPCEAAPAPAQDPAPDAAQDGPSAPEPALDTGAAGPIRTPRRRDPIGDLVGSLLRRFDGRIVIHELYEKLACFDRYPTGVMLAKVAKALDIEIEWPQFVAEDWAQPEIEARDPRSPFAFLWAPDRWAQTRSSGDLPDRGGPEPDTPPPD